ncbi:MAG: hypothetical protein AAF915_11675 [Cyanobacteria bacterium P01_D01_bin.50]
MGLSGSISPRRRIGAVKEISPFLNGEWGEPGNLLAFERMDNMDIRELCHMNPTTFSGM